MDFTIWAHNAFDAITCAQHASWPGFPFILLTSQAFFSAQAEFYFNPRFLSDDPTAVADLSGFENGQEIPPGTYRVDIYLNDGYMTTRDVTFDAGDKGKDCCPALPAGSWPAWASAPLQSQGWGTARR